jgi:transcriptional regulator with XRE-family HTH domain
MRESVVSKNPDPVDLHVGARLRYRRMLMGMSQEALGERLGVTFQQIQKYEKGQNRIGASRLYQVARVLDVSVGFFFEDLSERPASEDAEDDAIAPLAFVSTPEGLQLNVAFSRISDDATRRKIVDLVRTLAGCEAAAAG